jgi:membrane fusion protein, multidrug efflux system
MKAAGKHRVPLWGKPASMAIVLVAIGLGYFAMHRWDTDPSSDDASIDADVVHVAPLVGGRIIELGVRENERVAKGALLFQIDPVPYQLAVDQAEADLSAAEGQLDTQRRTISTQSSNATVATDQTLNAQANYDLAVRTAERLRPLAAQGYVPRQQFDQADVTARDAKITLQQAQERQTASIRAIDTDQAAEAIVEARRAALAQAQRHLADTTILAPHNGLVVGLTISAGEVVTPSQALFTLINTDEWFAVANFRETDLKAIGIGDCATAYSMVDRDLPVAGTVESIGWGVTDQERINLPRMVPYVERSLNWVRVAQRFPVRIRLEEPPARVMRLGASAVVEIKHGSKCR